MNSVCEYCQSIPPTGDQVVVNFTGCSAGLASSPPPLQITVGGLDQLRNGGTTGIYTIRFGVNGSPTAASIGYNASVGSGQSNYLTTYTSIPNNAGIIPLATEGNTGAITLSCVSDPQNAFPAVNGLRSNAVTLPANLALPVGSYVAGDIYYISIGVCCNATSGPSIKVTFLRSMGLTVSFDGTLGDNGTTPPCQSCPCNSDCELVKVPTINAVVRSTMDGSDIGEANFIICDTINYKKEKIQDNKCRIRYLPRSEVKTTRFRVCCPYIVSVLKGVGKTVQQKLMSQYNNLISPSFDFRTFYENIILFAMAKYILVRLLKDKFSIDSLLGKYNKQFIKELGKSRFCAFTDLFLNCNSRIYGYNQYFLWDYEDKK